MKIVILILLLMCIALPAQAESDATQTVINAGPDREMIQRLRLNEQQITAYIKIMRAKRNEYLSIPNHQWQQKLAVYQETIRLLATVLTNTQLVQFEGFMGCLLEEQALQYAHLSVEQ